MLISILLTLAIACQTHCADVGAKAPDFVLKDTLGHTAHLSNYQGKTVVINFWATWCAPCLAEMPELINLQRSYESKGLKVIGITYGRQQPGKVIKVVKKLGIKYQVLAGSRLTHLIVFQLVTGHPLYLAPPFLAFSWHPIPNSESLSRAARLLSSSGCV